ncbi:unnamed protein product [Lymnaea stagnalis]|uniref:Lipase domain-containing protein n=1 Tax=Lymnaea stagnalis TaxID=6523 RepID=A0AAV2IBD1_LYMST
MGILIFSTIMAAVSLAGSCVVAQADNVCYPVVGCFNNHPPNGNTHGVLPISPADMGVRMWLFTRSNRQAQDVLNYNNPGSITGSHFDPHKATKFIVHGFSSSFEKTSWILHMKDKFLNKGDFNVVGVDWSKGAVMPAYDQASANLRLVAAEIKLVLDIMKAHGLDLAKVHIVGHSLGAHLAGLVGHLFGNNVIGRISGLDPAEPNFKSQSTAVRLDKDDAIFVDVIHTDGSPFFLLIGYGLMQESGDVDFYVNGGEKQPGCTGSAPVGGSISCSHGRAHEIFLESIDTACHFTAYPCASFAQFENGECFTCNAGACSSVGYLADNYPARGKLYVDTHHASPYCGIYYHIKVFPYASAHNTSGLIYVQLTGSAGKTDFIPINSKNLILNHATEISTNVVFKNDIGNVVTAVDVKYEKDAGILGSITTGPAPTDAFTIGGLEVMTAAQKTWSASCRGTFNLHDKVALHIPTTAGRTSHACAVVG